MHKKDKGGCALERRILELVDQQYLLRCDVKYDRRYRVTPVAVQSSYHRAHPFVESFVTKISFNDLEEVFEDYPTTFDVYFFHLPLIDRIPCPSYVYLGACLKAML